MKRESYNNYNSEKKLKDACFQSNAIGTGVAHHQSIAKSHIPCRVGVYDIGRTLGRGRFATVKFGRHRQTGAPVAIKVILKDSLGDVFKLITREISSLKLLKHPNVVHILEVLASKTHVYIILEYMDGGELFDRIQESEKLEESEACRYFQQLIRGLDYCHSRGVYHRDLKPENLLLDEYDNLKISDFGLSALAQHQQNDGLFHTLCGSHNYIAPEVAYKEGYEGAPADLWSCGVILYVLLSGTIPFYESNLSNYSTYGEQVKQLELDFPDDFPEGPQQLVTQLLDPNPKTRITIEEIYKNDWFQSGFPLPGETNSLNLDTCCDNGQLEVHEPVIDSGPVLMNAFEIISMLSKGLDLSGLFTGYEGLKKQTKFISTHPAKEIIKKIELFSLQLGYQVMTKNYKMRIQSQKQGRKGFLCMATEVREVGSSLFMVELRKTSGDSLEYREFQGWLCAGLGDVVWKSEADMMGY